MARLRKQTSAETRTIAPASTPPTPPSEQDLRAAPAPIRRRRPSLRIPLDEHGKPLLEQLEDDKRQALVQAVSKQQQQGVTPELAGLLIAAAVQLESSIVARKLKIPREDAEHIIAPKPPLDEMIAKQTAVVLNKYNALSRLGDEVVLLSLIASWRIGIVHAMRAYRERKQDHERETEDRADVQNNPGTE